MIDRVGQVWEDDGGALVYLVFKSNFLPRNETICLHNVLVLCSKLRLYSAGETIHEYERADKHPWEVTNRRRLA